MDDLWTLVHGAWVWRSALVLSISAAVFYVWYKPRRRAARDWRAARGLWFEAPSSDHVVVTGTLVAQGAVERFEDGAAVAATAVDNYGHHQIGRRARRLVVKSDDGVDYEIEGDVVLAAGSDEYRPGITPQALPGAIVERLDGRSAPRFRANLIFRSLADGDRVRVRGIQSTVVDGVGYRELGHRLVLSEVIASAAATPRVRTPPPLAFVLPTLGAAFIFVLVFGAVGECAHRRSANVSVSYDADFDEIVEAHWSTRVAAMTPFRRGGAVDALETALADTTVDRAVVVARAAAGLADSPADAVAMLHTHRYFRLAIERAVALDRPAPEAAEWAAESALAIGELELASDLFGDSSDEMAIRAHLLAGNLERAAAAAAARVDRLRVPGEHESDPDFKRYRLDDLARFRCLATALRGRLGNRTAVKVLESHTEVRACGLLLADQRAERRELVWPLVTSKTWFDPPWALLARLLLFESGELSGAEVAEHADFIGASPNSSWLLEGPLVTLGWSVADRAPIAYELLVANVKAEVLVGRPDNARALARRAGAVKERSAKGLRALIALHSGDLAQARRELAAGPGTGSMNDWLISAVGGLEAGRFSNTIGREEQNEALRGRGVSRYLSPPEVAFIAPFLSPRALADYLDKRPARIQGSTDSLIGDLGAEAKIAHHAGRPELAAELYRGAQTILDAARRRDIAMLLAVVDG